MPRTLEATSATRQSATVSDAASLADFFADRTKPAAIMPRAAFAGLILCVLAFWILEHPYAGIVNDSLFYALAALARLHPQSLAHDIFLGPGSQDHYTIFSPIVAALIRAMGIGQAAALVTAASQAALYCCAALLARRIVPSGLAVFSVALLVLLPSLYGSYHIFSYTEDFMTSRVPCEALVLASLAAAFARRYILTAVCAAGAMLLHPLTGLPCLVMLFLLLPGLRPSLMAGLALAGLVALSLVAWLMPFWRIARIDPDWFALLHWRMWYAFPSLWTLHDWGSTSVPLATLIAGAVGNSSRMVRTVCRAALVLGLSGIIITLLGQDVLRILLIAQVQPWRWLWLSSALAVLLLPAIAIDCWRSGDVGRALIVLLGAAWVSYYQIFVLVISVLAIAVAARGVSIEPQLARRLLIGAWAILALAVVLFLGLPISELMRQSAAVRGSSLFQSTFWITEHRVRPWAVGGVVPVALFSMIWRLAANRADRRARWIVLTIGIASCCALAPFARSAWGSPEPSEALRAKFASWRHEIPPSDQVLIEGVPVIPWLLLDRSSYWSVRQMAGIAFSRPTAMELARRQRALNNVPPTLVGTSPVNGLCASDPLIGFVVAREDLGPTPFAPITITTGGVSGRLYLYSCTGRQRQSSK